MNRKSLLFIGGLALTVLLVFLLANNTGVFGIQNNKERERQTSFEKNIVLPSSEIVLGQNFIVGIPDKTLDTETKNFLKEVKPAGVILYSRNYETPNQLKNLINELQEIAEATTNHSYLIMIDEEPGGATRLNLFKNVFDFGTPDWNRIENDIKEMASVGINVDLAPLADFPFNEDSFIKDRVPAHTTKALVDFNKKFIALLQQNGVSATLKHFPGMGVFIDDPHIKLPYTNDDQKIIDKSIQLFKSGIDNGVDFVMTGHAVYDVIDPNVPATLSKKITTDILRNNLAFTGLIITDDLSDMPFIIGKNIDRAEATVEALRAGHNLVIFSHRPEKTKEIFEKLLQRVQNDQELKSLIESNYRKVVYFKQKHALSFFQNE